MREMKESGLTWLGPVPDSWELLPAKRLFRLTNDRGNEEPVLLAATQKYGMYPQYKLEGVVRVQENTDLQTFRTVHKNDFVISLRSFQGGFERSDYEGVCSPAYQTFRAQAPVDYQYFKYLFKSPSFIDHMNSYTLGIREGRTIKFSDFANCLIPVPPLDEQRRIADFLDAKCVEIDRATASAEASIEKYKEYEVTLISDAASGPWPRARLNRIASFYNGDRSSEYPSGDDIVAEGVPFVTSDALHGRFISREFPKHITRAKYNRLRGVKVRRNDIIFCLRGSVGNCSFNDYLDEGALASSLAVARPRGCDGRWLNYVLSAATTIDQAIASAIGATSKNLAANQLGQVYVSLPPLDEQRRIADHLDAKCAAIANAIAAKQAIIDDLKAYKQSLIYEVVTGKREV